MEMDIRKVHPSGAIVISKKLHDSIVKMQYIDYTIPECREMFRKYYNLQKSKLFLNKKSKRYANPC